MQEVHKEVPLAIDIEASGSTPGRYALLSIGTCIVTSEVHTYEEAKNRGLLFYEELRPHTQEFDLSALRVGCSELEVLKDKGDPSNPKKSSFNPSYTMGLLARVASDSIIVAKKFRAFIQSHSRGGDEITGIADTAFFDSAWMQWWFGKHRPELSPIHFHHLGLDLRSVLVGHQINLDAKLKDLGAPRNECPHHAGHDALYLANQTSILFRKLGFKL